MFSIHEQPETQLYCCKRLQQEESFLKSKMHRNLSQHSRQLFPHSWGSLFSYKDIPFLIGKEYLQHILEKKPTQIHNLQQDLCLDLYSDI